MEEITYKVDRDGKVVNCPTLSIPIIVISDEEAKMSITQERIDAWEELIGESFFDYNGELFNHKVIGGYLIGRFPEKVSELLEVINSPYGEVQNFEEVFDTFDFYPPDPEYIKYVLDFVNLTEATKKRVNEVLISVEHHYASRRSNK